jgi:acylphosphatase
VLIEATGDRDKLELFCELLRAGNRFVDVRELRIREQDETVVYDDFTIR